MQQGCIRALFVYVLLGFSSFVCVWRLLKQHFNSVKGNSIFHIMLRALSCGFLSYLFRLSLRRFSVYRSVARKLKFFKLRLFLTYFTQISDLIGIFSLADKIRQAPQINFSGGVQNWHNSNALFYISFFSCTTRSNYHYPPPHSIVYTSCTPVIYSFAAKPYLFRTRTLIILLRRTAAYDAPINSHMCLFPQRQQNWSLSGQIKSSKQGEM